MHIDQPGAPLCAFLGVWVPGCVRMPRALSVGLGGAGAHLALPLLLGEPGRGSQRLQAPSRCWEAQGGSSAVLQTEASHRNASSHFRGRSAEELSAPLQSWKEASGFCREPVTSRPPPGSLEGLPPLCHTPACATQKHCWSFLESPGEHVHMDADPVGAEWGRVGA